jgi:A/G-specific adenine glycosylase|tara:strand:+ start:635 stop:1690 length:1056 start_codon:yes stop_codon:yes gene_type:complete
LDWFAAETLAWFDAHGRHDLPWQSEPTPYRVWVSEIMLQQTQVSTVIPYYERFMARFPDVDELAAASLDEVLHLWTGLGYYARARNLHKAARGIVEAGAFPDSLDKLQALPGIGPSTAGAITAIALKGRGVILEGNVRRLLSRFHTIEGYHGERDTLDALWQTAAEHTPDTRTADYTQAIMDLGSMVCTRTNPHCNDCPVSARCAAFEARQVHRFPAPRPSREKPVRAARMFVVTTPEDACLLEQRPERGIWGGLWTPPERSAETTPDALCLEYGIHYDTIVRTHAAPAFRHSFTHYHLDIEPFYLALSEAPDTAVDVDNHTWYHPDQSQPLGLAAPAVKLLAALGDFELA